MSSCEHCKFENDPTSLFCGGCGNDLGIECDRCGEINKNQTFCKNCGQIVSSSLETRYDSKDLDDSSSKLLESDKNAIYSDQILPEPGKLVDLISTSVSAYKQNFRSFIFLALINGIPTLILGIIIRTLLETELISLSNFQQYNDSQISENLLSEFKAIPIWKIITIVFFVAIGLVANLISIMSIIVGSAQFANSEKVSPIICINYSLSRIGKLMLLSLFLIGLFIIPFVLSLLLIGIPILIYLVVRWYFALPSMVLDNTGVTQSIQKSWDLVDKRWWVTFGTGLVILILMTIPTYALNLVSSNLNSDFILLLGDVLVSTLISPFQAIATGLYFLSLKKYPKI